MIVHVPDWITYGLGILFHLWAVLLITIHLVNTRVTFNNWAVVPFIGLNFFYSWLVWG